MNKLSNIQYFQLFCLECYRNSKGITGLAALKEFKEVNVFAYLEEGYEVLHTQGKNYLIEDITDFIQRRKLGHY